MGSREALSLSLSLSPILFNSLFSPSLCPSPLREPAHRLSTYFWLSTLAKSGEVKQNTKTLAMWVLRQSRR